MMEDGGLRLRIYMNVLSMFLCISGILGENQHENFLQEFTLSESQLRFARLRCLQQYPRADTIKYADTSPTHCFMQCFLYRLGLINLHTRGLDSSKFMDVWDNIDQAFDEKCADRFAFDEPLSGKCWDCYRKLMEFREHCLELFEYTFGTNRLWKSDDADGSKSVGQSATEFCDSLDNDPGIMEEDYDSMDESFLLQYKKKLECLLQNYHYIDAYGRVDVHEVLLSYYEAKVAVTTEVRFVIEFCAHRANSKYRRDYIGDLVLELQTCLKRNSPSYAQVAHIRDDISRGY